MCSLATTTLDCGDCDGSNEGSQHAMYELQEAPIGKESRSKEEAETPGWAGQAGTREQWLLVAAGWLGERLA